MKAYSKVSNDLINGEIAVKKILGASLAFLMMLGVVFIGDTFSSNGSFSAVGQQVTVKHRKRGVASRTYRGGKYVARKTWHGTKYVGRKTYHGARWTGRKVVKGTRYSAHKTKRGVKRVFR